MAPGASSNASPGRATRTPRFRVLGAHCVRPPATRRDNVTSSTSRLLHSSTQTRRPILDKVQSWTDDPEMSTDPANLLREKGVQVTAQRLAVFRAVSGRPHCTADDVAEDVRAEIGAISRQAVYDALGLLSEKGLIRRIQPARSPALYEDRVGDNHHHLICRACGKTVDVDCAVGDTPCLTAAAAGRIGQSRSRRGSRASLLHPTPSRDRRTSPRSVCRDPCSTGAFRPRSRRRGPRSRNRPPQPRRL